MIKYVCIAVAVALLLLPSPGPQSRASADVLVTTSTHFIQVPASATSPPGERISLAATLYQPRLFPAAPAVIYVHGWGGRRLIGDDNLAHTISAAGYTVLSYTARGFGGGESGGRVSLAGPDEINDLKQLIDWLLTDPDGVIGPRVTKIGVIGGSYGGSHSFQIADDPRVSAVVPLVGWTNLESALFPNGAILYKLGLAEFYGGLDTSVGAPPFYNYDRLQFEMFDAAAEGRGPTDAVRAELAARSIAARDDDGRERLKPSRQPRAPIFIIQSWDDYLFPSPQVLDIYSQITAPKQIYMGRRGHPPGGNESTEEEAYIGTQIIRWLNRYLWVVGGKDAKTIASAPEPGGFLPETYAQYPPADAETTALYLKAGGAITRKRKGENREESAGGVFQPRSLRSSQLGAEIPSRQDMFSATTEPAGSVPRALVYTTAPFATDTEVFGPGEFTLYVSSPTSATIDLITRLYDVAPDGSETEVTVGITRAYGLAAGEAKAVTFRDFGDHWVFRAGHALRVKVTNLDFPDFRPPGDNDGQLSLFTLRTGKKSPSSLTLHTR